MALTKEQIEFTLQKDKENDLPAGTTHAVMGIESGWSANAKSRKKAEGWMQFMKDSPQTGYVRKKYGLTDPYDFYQAATAGARYLGDLKKQYGDVQTALVAYNGGGKAVRDYNAGKMWAASKDYLTKFNSGKYHPDGRSPTGGAAQWSVAGHVGLNEQNALENNRVLPDPSVATPETRLDYYNNLSTPRQIWESAKSQFETNNWVYNWINTEGMKEYDPNFAWNEELKKQYLEDIPEAQQGYIMKAMSEQEALRRRQAVQQHLWEQQKIATMGFVPALAGGLLESFLEPETYLFMAPIFNGGFLAYQASRIGRMMAGAMTGAMQNVGVDYLTGGFKPSYDNDELVMSALYGAFFGSLGGIGKPNAPIKPLVQPQAAEMNAANAKYYSKAVISKMKKMGYVIPENWRIDPNRPEDITKFAFKPIDYADRTRFPSRIIDTLNAETKDILHRLGIERSRLRRETNRYKWESQQLDKEINKTLNAPYDFSGGKSLTPKGIETTTPKTPAPSEPTPLPSYTPKRVSEVIDNTNGNSVVGLKRTFKDGKTYTSLSTINELEKLAKNGSSEHIRVTAQRLREQLGDYDLPLFYTTASSINGDRGRYGPAHYIAIHKTSRKSAPESTLLHEVEHALSLAKLRYGLANPDTEHGKIASELKTCFDIARDEAKKQFGLSDAEMDSGKGFYGLSNIEEFVATLHQSDVRKKWIDFLTSIKLSDGTTIWSKFVTAVRKLLGFSEQEENLYFRSLGLTEEINSKRLEIKGNKTGRAISDIDIPEGHVKLTESGAVQDPDILAKAEQSDLPTTETLSPIETVDMLDKAVSKAGGYDVFGIGLDLQHKFGGKGVPNAVKGVFSALIGTNVGTKNHGVIRESAAEFKEMMKDRILTPFDAVYSAAFNDFIVNNKVKMHQKGEAWLNFNEMVHDAVINNGSNYPEEVMRCVKAVRELTGEMREWINNPEKDLGRKKRGLTEAEIIDPDTGETLRVGGLPENPNYIPRRYLPQKLSAIADETNGIGRDGVIQFFQGAYLSGNPEMSEALAKTAAEWHVSTLERVHVNNIHNDISMGMQGFNYVALKESMLQHGMSEKDANLLIRSFTNFSGSSQESRLNSSLKYRSPINEKFTMEIMDKTGEMRIVSIKDFVDTNVHSVLTNYTSRMSGAVSVARHLNVYKTADFDSIISHALREQLGNVKLSPAKRASLEKDLRYAFDRIMDIPTEEFSVLSKALNMFNKFNVMRLMGQASFNQVVETSNILGTVGLKGTLEACPELGKALRDAKTGKLNNEFLAGIEDMIGGSGLEFSRQLNFGADDWVSNRGDTKLNRILDKVDAALDRGAAGVLHYSGMTPLTVYQKKLFSLACFNRLMDIAHGIGDRKYFSQDRLHWMGLTEENFQNILSDLRRFTTKKRGEGGSKSYMLDFEGWMKAKPENYHKLALAVRRESRRVIQENDLASMIPIMGTTLGKTMFQFMHFAMQAWSKSTLFSIHHRDASSLMTVLYGGTLACLTYLARTYLQAAGMDEKEKKEFFDKRLSLPQIVANSTGRIQQASFIPNVWDTFSPVPFFSGMRTTSDVSSLASAPSVQTINTLVGMKKLIRNGWSDEEQTTRRDVRSMVKLLPLSNTIPAMWLMNDWVNSFPTSEKEK